MEVYLVFEPLRGCRKGLRHEGVVQSVRSNTEDRMIMDHMDRMDHSVAILAQEFWSATTSSGGFCMGIDLAGASFSGIVIGWLASAYHHYQDALEAVTRLAGPLDAVSKLAGACSERCPSCPILVPPSCAPVICQDDAGTQRGLFLVSGLGLGLFFGTLLGLRLGRPVAPATRVVHVPGLVPVPPAPARVAVAPRRPAPPLRRLSVDASSW